MFSPDADYKFFFTASMSLERFAAKGARGRWERTYREEVLKDIKKRDATDYNRKEGPLRQAKDALLIDTTPIDNRWTVDMMPPFIDLSRLKPKD